MTDTHQPAPPGELLETQEVLVADWGVVPLAEAEEDLNWRLLLEALAERIAWLLRSNPDKLVNAMYVLDIPEARYGQAMREPTTEAKALSLAQAILERESEKIAMRRKYANRQGGYLGDLYSERETPSEPAPAPPTRDGESGE